MRMRAECARPSRRPQARRVRSPVRRAPPRDLLRARRTHSRTRTLPAKTCHDRARRTRSPGAPSAREISSPSPRSGALPSAHEATKPGSPRRSLPRTALLRRVRSQGRARGLSIIRDMDVTESNFQSAVIERSHTLPVVVDFWAEWCGPCRQLGPVIERAVEARAGKIELAKLDVDANPTLARTYRIQSIPAVKAFKDGQV